MRNLCKLLFLAISLPLCSTAQNFTGFISYITALPEGQRQAVADSFYSACPELPYYENDTVACFIWKGIAQSVSMAGDANSWNPAVTTLQKITGTDFWYRMAFYEPEARLDYKYVLNGTNWILDPKNPHTCLGGYGPNSELRMPGWIEPEEILNYPGIPHGTLFDTVFFSAALSNSRHVKVYLPADYSTGTGVYPVIVFHDGPDFLSLGAAVNILDYLIAEKKILPVIGVFIPPVNREDEYAGNQKEPFSEFVINDILAWVNGKYRTVNLPQFTAVAGVSNGGNISLWMGLHYPGTFGHVAALSSNVESSISSGFQSGPLLGLDMYLDIGVYDISVLINLVYNLKNILEEKGYVFGFHEFPEGHSWGNWKAHTDNFLTRFFPYTQSESETGAKKNDTVLTCSPNPGKNEVEVSFCSPGNLPAVITLTPLSGNAEQKLWEGTVAEGDNTIRVPLKNAAPGTYLVMLQTQQFAKSCKLILE